MTLYNFYFGLPCALGSSYDLIVPIISYFFFQSPPTFAVSVQCSVLGGNFLNNNNNSRVPLAAPVTRVLPLEESMTIPARRPPKTTSLSRDRPPPSSNSTSGNIRRLCRLTGEAQLLLSRHNIYNLSKCNKNGPPFCTFSYFFKHFN